MRVFIIVVIALLGFPSFAADKVKQRKHKKVPSATEFTKEDIRFLNQSCKKPCKEITDKEIDIFFAETLGPEYLKEKEKEKQNEKDSSTD